MDRSTCPRCGAPVIPLQAASPQSPAKIYCGPRCQKLAEKARWLARRRAQSTTKETT